MGHFGKKGLELSGGPPDLHVKGSSISDLDCERLPSETLRVQLKEVRLGLEQYDSATSYWEVVGSPTLEAFKRQLDSHLSVML